MRAVLPAHGGVHVSIRVLVQHLALAQGRGGVAADLRHGGLSRGKHDRVCETKQQLQQSSQCATPAKISAEVRRLLLTFFVKLTPSTESKMVSLGLARRTARQIEKASLFYTRLRCSPSGRASRPRTNPSPPGPAS